MIHDNKLDKFIESVYIMISISVINDSLEHKLAFIKKWILKFYEENNKKGCLKVYN
jgi:hypothetical protein